MSRTVVTRRVLLLEKVREAIHQGRQLWDWVSAAGREVTYFDLDLGADTVFPHQTGVFFGQVLVDGSNRSLMGCRQRLFLPRLNALANEEAMQTLMFRQLLSNPCWTNADGRAAGFTVRKVIAEQDGGIYQCENPEVDGAADWRDLCEARPWICLLIDIHDFAFQLGRIRVHFEQSAFVVQHHEFVRIERKPAPLIEYRLTIAYPFVPLAPRKNIFGFGPGKFGTAIKTYSLSLARDRSVTCDMTFFAAPRCEKVFDFGFGMPDPIYGGLKMLEVLSAGRLRTQRAKDRIDSQMLAIHCRVHQKLIEGLIRRLFCEVH